MAHLGIELTPSHVRAVRRGWRGALTTAETAWRPDAPEEAVQALRAALGNGAVSSVRLAVSPLLLHVKEVHIPNVGAMEQWRAIALQPARYFAEPSGDSTLAVAWHRDSRLAFATDAERVEHWSRAFGALGPITMVLPVAAALPFSGLPNATYAVAVAGDNVATATIAEGRLTGARVARRGSTDSARELPPYNELRGEWRAAFGAASARAVEDWESLTTAESQQRLRARRLRSFATTAAAFVFALIAALAALDYSRASYEARLDRAIAVAENAAQPGLALRRRLAGLEHEAQLLRGGSRGAADALQTLAALSERLPRDVVVMRLRITDDEWQVSGRARGGKASAIIPALESDARFTDVRMTSASTRFREDAQEFESFSVAFRVRPTD